MKGILLKIARALSGGAQKQRIKNIQKEYIRHEILALPLDSITVEKKQVLDYLRDNPLSTFPYSFYKKYKQEDVKVFLDERKGLQYVIHEGKKLYYTRHMTTSHIQESYSGIAAEQDIESPHRYLSENFKVEKGDIVVDIGVAEGNFALSVIENVNEIYLFETEERWIEALQATFEPWKEKVHIINKFVSDTTSKNCVSLDSLFTNKGVSFLKIDVEGAERKVLKGAMNIITKNNPLKIALCTYHRQNDETAFTNLLKQYQFDISFSKGYMIFTKDRNIRKPYLRRGVMRAVRGVV